MKIEELTVVDAEIALPTRLVVRLIERALEQRAPAAAPAEPSTRLHKLQQRGPAIGEQGLYGIYAGIVRGFNGEKDGVLEVLAESPERMKWDDAMKWAESVGGRLPTRKEAAPAFANVPELFKEEAYWTCEQYAGDESYAWCQSFYDGYQYGSRKYYERRARAVRRLPFE